MDLALNNLQRLICHKNQPTNQPTVPSHSQLWAIEHADCTPCKIPLPTQSDQSNLYIILTVFFKLFMWQTSTQPNFILKVLEGCE